MLNDLFLLDPVKFMQHAAFDPKALRRHRGPTIPYSLKKHATENAVRYFELRFATSELCDWVLRPSFHRLSASDEVRASMEFTYCSASQHEYEEYESRDCEIDWREQHGEENASGTMMSRHVTASTLSIVRAAAMVMKRLEKIASELWPAHFFVMPS